VRYAVLVFLCAAATIAYVQRNSLGVVETEMRKEFNLSEEQSAWVVSSSFFLTYALFQVPTGWLGHIWGSRRALPGFSLICAAAALFFTVATGFPALVASRGVMGFSQAGLFPCATGTIKSWMPVSQRAFASGLLTASMQVGGAGGVAATGWLATQIGWRNTFALFAIPGFLWSVCFYLWFRDSPYDHPSVNNGELELLGNSSNELRESQTSNEIEPIPWRELLLNRPMAWFCAQQFFRAAGYVFYSSWFTTYLKNARGVTNLTLAGILTSLPLCAYALGSFAGGWFSDWLLIRTGSRGISRKGLTMATQVAFTVFLIAAYPVRDATIAVLIISAGSFCAAIGGPIAYAVAIDMGQNHVRPVFSLMNMWGNIGAFALPLVVPYLVGKGADTNWNRALVLIGAIHVAAALCWLGFDPGRPVIAEPRSDLIAKGEFPDTDHRNPGAES
jgi:ACS family glucarate transporter-like MFS transporter